MSKKEKESTVQEMPFDYQIEMKNMQYTIVLRDKDIASLKEQLGKNGTYIQKLEGDIFELKKQIAYYYNIEKKLAEERHSNDLLKKDIENLKEEILNQKKTYLEEKTQSEKLYNARINQMQTIIDNYNQKLEMTNKIMEENKQMKTLVETAQKEAIDVKRKSEKDLVDLAIKNKLKLSILKKKMYENIKNSQIKVTELNMQYMDVSSKLTLLQNHQLLTQLEYLQEQLDEYSQNNELLKKKNQELIKDIQIHKEVEISLAEKNKKLKIELSKEREEKNTDEKNIPSDLDKINDENDKKDEQSERKKYSINQDMINLEKKILNLEKQLKQKKADFNFLKDKYNFIENYLRNYEKKFLGIINFLQDCLNKFFIDEELLSNREINIHINDLKQGDFTSLNKEEQYSVLIILMKYLMPMVNQANMNNEQKKVNKINLKFKLPEIRTHIPIDINKYKHIKYQRHNFNIRSMSAENIGIKKENGISSMPDNSFKSNAKKLFYGLDNKLQAKYKNSSSLNTGISTGN
jgi:DNA repair exonuclease SbcCD ATPase subunit